MSETVKVVFNGQAIELPKETISQGIEKGEISITDEKIKLFTDEELSKREKKIESTSYNKGKVDGVEIEWKETKRKLGIEIEGKNGDEILNAFKEKVLTDAKIEPSKKISELEQIASQLRTNLQTAEKEKNDLLTNFQNKEKEYKINSLLTTIIPDNAVSETFTKNDVSALFKANGYAIDIQEGKEVALFNGEIVKDEKTLEPLPVKNVMDKFVIEKGFIKKDDGRGEKDKTKDQIKAGSLEAFIKEMEAKGIKHNTEPFIKEMQSRIKDKTLVV